MQLAVVILAAALLAAAARWKAQRPADAARLRLPVAELRSQAAELLALSVENTAGRVNARFVKNQAIQLRVAQRHTGRELAKLRPWPELAVRQHEALADAEELRTRIDSAAISGQSDGDPAQALRDRLEQRERALRN